MRQGRDARFLECVGRLAAETRGADAETLTAMVEQIAPMLRGIGGTYAKLAIAAGAFVERGASPLALAEVVPERAVYAMACYVALLQLWPKASGGRPLPEFRPPVSEAQLNEIEDTLTSYAKRNGKSEQQALHVAYSWFSVNDWLNPLISSMMRSREFRAAMDRREQVRDGAAALSGHLPRAYWLHGLCLVCDDEPLIVLDPTTGRGFRLTMSGVGDNYQLHTLLADRLIRPSHAGLLNTEPPEPAWVEAATTGASGPFAASAPIVRRLRLFDGHGRHVSPEGRPADIEPLDGVRVLVLHPPLGACTWVQGRSYVSMLPTLTLDREISPAEAADWLSRIAPAREEPT